MKKVCERHSSIILVYESADCELCLRSKANILLLDQLLILLEWELPAGHFPSILEDTLYILGPYWGYCYEDCNHPAFNSYKIKDLKFGLPLYKSAA